MAKVKKYDLGGLTDVTPEDVADAKMRERARRAYDAAMPEADTTYGNLAKRLPRRSAPDAQNTPDNSSIGSTLKDFINRKLKPKSDDGILPMKKGGNVSSSASKRADGIAQRGKTKGTMVAMCGGGYMKGKK